MLRDGEKGVVIQRGLRTYAITPHLPCGLTTPEMLRRIADVAEYFGATIKCTSAQRIAIIGLREEDVDPAWERLGGQNAGHMTGNCVRSVRACPGLDFCKRARQDSLGVGLALDRLYHGRPLPGKLKIGVAGCGNQCSEASIKDIGLVGGNRGWRILVGGAAGMYARIAKELSIEEFSTERTMEVVDAIIRFYENEAREHERLGDVIARVGLAKLQKAVGIALPLSA